MTRSCEWAVACRESRRGNPLHSLRNACSETHCPAGCEVTPPTYSHRARKRRPGACRRAPSRAIGARALILTAPKPCGRGPRWSGASARNQEQIAQEAALDGFYVLRTNVPAAKLDTAAVVRSYKSLSQVERAFRSLKTLDLHVRPFHHYTEARGQLARLARKALRQRHRQSPHQAAPGRTAGPQLPHAPRRTRHAHPQPRPSRRRRRHGRLRSDRDPDAAAARGPRTARYHRTRVARMNQPLGALAPRNAALANVAFPLQRSAADVLTMRPARTLFRLR